MERLFSVSLCMIVKDEERVLKRCLESVEDLVDEIIIVDTGSTDNTIEIANSFHAKLKSFKWTNNFSEARNYSLSFATCDWVLVLDADEYLDKNHKIDFITAINQEDVSSYYVNQVSFIDETYMSHTVSNLMHRLFRNYQGARYVGSIHEQLEIPAESKKGSSSIVEINFYHDGYLKTVYDSKEKSARNIKLIKSILRDDPSNAFHLFNLGTEYVGANDYDKGIESYNKAYQQVDLTEGFAPKLVLYRINAFMLNGDYKMALAAIEEGILKFPQYTDLMFQRAEIEERLRKYTKAIRSYEICIQMGETPLNLRYSNLVWSIGPYIKLIALYEKFEDYDMALKYYVEYFKTKNADFRLMYGFGLCLKRAGYSERSVCESLESYLDLNDINSLIVYLNILLNNQYYDKIKRVLETIENERSDLRIEEIALKTEFYLKNFGEYLINLEKREELKINVELMTLLVSILNSNCLEYDVCLKKNPEFEDFVRGIISHPEVDQALMFDKDASELDILYSLLRETVLIKEYYLFEKLLNALNYFESDEVLLRLAKLYDEFGYYDMAKKEIFRSIKHFDKLDYESAKLLCKYMM